MTTPSDPRALLRSRSYLRLLVIAAALGVPVSAAAYGFLALVNYLQPEIFTHLPHGLGFQAEPWWWPLPVLAVGGALTGLAIRYLPGAGGASPAEEFKTHRPPTPIPPRSSSTGRRRWGLWSRIVPRTPSGPCCCSSCARAWPTAYR